MSTCNFIYENFQGLETLCNGLTEGRTDYCAKHNRMMRKAEETAAKDADKLATKLLKQKVKNSEPRKKVNPVSDKQKGKNKEYGKIAEEYKRENPSCVARINGYCTGKTESVHHKRGRGRYLLDVSMFLPCCLSCHTYIENHPEEAKERGWSESRLGFVEPHKI
jgi:ElaB/YqjD/DUF883 family membrane-anchored ribosome-binding protein